MTRAHSISLHPAAVARQGGASAVMGGCASVGGLLRNAGRSFRRTLLH